MEAGGASCNERHFYSRLNGTYNLSRWLLHSSQQTPMSLIAVRSTTNRPKATECTTVPLNKNQYLETLRIVPQGTELLTWFLVTPQTPSNSFNTKAASQQSTVFVKSKDHGSLSCWFQVVSWSLNNIGIALAYKQTHEALLQGKSNSDCYVSESHHGTGWTGHCILEVPA